MTALLTPAPDAPTDAPTEAPGAPPPRAPRCGGPSALVLGGGLAGIAAAVSLADAGWRVTLLEGRKHLGGRATSHVDPRTGEPLDNCQHVLIRRCTRLVALLGRLGVADDIEWHDRLHFLRPGGRHDVLRRSPLPAPLHLAPSLLGCGFLGAGAKLAVSSSMLRVIAGDRGSDDVSFADWLRARRQPAEAVERFWSPVVVSALNECVERASSAAALHVFREGFLADRAGYEVGVPRVPLVRLYDGAGEVLRRAGGTVLAGTPARAVHMEGGRVRGVACGAGRPFRADAYVCALPPERVAKVFAPPAADADPRLSAGGRLAFSPIVGIHLWFDRPVLYLPHAALVGSSLHWLFDRGVGPDGRQHLHGVISAARDHADLPAARIVAEACSEVARFLPAARGAVLLRGEVIKERRATFSPAVGAERLRPEAAGPIDNLFLAGDYCRTGWPATMEGAVRSGELAAAAAVEAATRAPRESAVPA